MSEDKARRRDAIRSQLREIGRQMGGINPKLAIYKQLQEESNKLNDELNRLRQ
jgi:hypothetical protein